MGSDKRRILKNEHITVTEIKKEISDIFNTKCRRKISHLYSLKENVDFSQCKALNIAYLLAFLDNACYFMHYNSLLFRFIAKGAYREEVESFREIDLLEKEKMYGFIIAIRSFGNPNFELKMMSRVWLLTKYTPLTDEELKSLSEKYYNGLYGLRKVLDSTYLWLERLYLQENTIIMPIKFMAGAKVEKKSAQ